MDLKNAVVTIDNENGHYFVLDVQSRLKPPDIVELLRIDGRPGEPRKRLVGADLIKRAGPCTSQEDLVLTDLLLHQYDSIASAKSTPIFSCNVDFKAYQFRPLLKYLSNPERRLLIADETGLGKTIESAYVLLTEMCQAPLNRVLIVCPSQLKRKWRGELRKRFGLLFYEANVRQLMEYLSKPESSFHFILSMDGLRSQDIEMFLGTVAGSHIDFLIIDEIHNMIGRGGDTLRRRLGIALSSISSRAIGLSATPIHIDILDLKRVLEVLGTSPQSDEDFLNEMELNGILNDLYRLLGQNRWDDRTKKVFLERTKALSKKALLMSESKAARGLLDGIGEIEVAISINHDVVNRQRLRSKLREITTVSNCYTRSRRIEVGEERERRVVNITINLDTDLNGAYQNGQMVSISEKELYQNVDKVLERTFSFVHRRQLSSSLPAMVDLLRTGARGFDLWNGEEWEEVKRPKLTNAEMNECKRLVQLYGLLNKDTKWDALKNILSNLKTGEDENIGKARKVIVFTQWIPTLNMFKRKSAQIDAPAFFISGMDREEEKSRTMEQFQNHPGFCVLFATDVVSEGVDIQAADYMVNYDLPFNPQRIEQRIGRIDRVGQQSEAIGIVNLLVGESLDQYIFDVLLERIGIFKKGVGEIPPIISEGLERGSSIDESEIVRAIEEKSIRERLMSCDALSRLDELMDEEIMGRWLRDGKSFAVTNRDVFNKMLRTVLGNNIESEPLDEGTSLWVSGITEDDLNTISRLVKHAERNDVLNELNASYDKNGIRFKFSKSGKPGMHIGIMHPLMRASLAIVTKLYRPDSAGMVEAPALLLEQGCLGPNISGMEIFLIEYGFEGSVVKRKELVFWGRDKKEGHLEKMGNLSLNYLLSKINAISTRDSDRRVGLEITSKMLAAIQPDYHEWWKNNKDLDTSLASLSNERRLAFLDAEISRLTTISMSEPNSYIGYYNKKETKGNVNLLIWKIASLKKELESVSKGELDAARDWREPKLLSTFIIQ